MIRRSRLRAALCASALAAPLAIAGCTVGPDFHTPQVTSPRQWGDEPRTDSRLIAGQIDTQWWHSFHDPVLDSLVDRLAAQNLDLQTAGQRIDQARAQMHVAASAGLPQASWAGSYDYRHLSTHGIFSLAQPQPDAHFQFDFFAEAISAGWDLDLFGMIRRAVEAQRAGELESLQARRAVALAAVSDLATSYMQLRGVQEQARITRDNLALAQRNLALVQSRFGNGVATTLELAQARAQVAQIASTLPDLDDREATLINAIGFLLAQPPRALEAELRAPGAQPPVPPTVPVGLPSELARRRPDVLAAEARLHMATAEVGMAQASFYPDITLTGNMGTESLSAADFFALPARQFAAGPTLNVPVFQGGRLMATLHLRRAQQKEAAIAFRKTVLGAWNDVDNAMTSYTQAQRARDQVREAFTQNEAALAAARQRYAEGAADYLNVVAAQGALLESQSALAANQTKIETTLVALYRALGGGWQYAEPAPGTDAARTQAHISTNPQPVFSGTAELMP
ncbi:efflux transporter outer membrane subunit [Tanticharoenia sakaeratensis]|uniref:Outer membrane protein n=1 Tax=Tanticharoenia sakaeratensis NBRC 103193 TaxID=1231623 RepID=A0A0D6MQY2_9PROT|nr:efflux transporter outer membrane subunit [Tanticharoenia sakaeratensis]GAN55826.1 outer membrane protein [Tanticharoenia sakaeratensis NBRC 103193]GBQ25376.1 RND efflux system outer membrane lipoprotein [Tanticharoenia sakaeratensis NBRC 103193]